MSLINLEGYYSESRMLVAARTTQYHHTVEMGSSEGLCLNTSSYFDSP